MKQSDAIRHLYEMQKGIIKLRSIMAEDGFITDEKGLETLHMTSEDAGKVWKYVWGEKSILPILSKLLDKVDETNKLAPMDFYNMMYIALNLEPIIGAAAGITAAMADNFDFPEEIDINWLRGWDS